MRGRGCHGFPRALTCSFVYNSGTGSHPAWNILSWLLGRLSPPSVVREVKIGGIITLCLQLTCPWTDVYRHLHGDGWGDTRTACLGHLKKYLALCFSCALLSYPWIRGSGCFWSDAAILCLDSKVIHFSATYIMGIRSRYFLDTDTRPVWKVILPSPTPLIYILCSGSDCRSVTVVTQHKDPVLHARIKKTN